MTPRSKERSLKGGGLRREEDSTEKRDSKETRAREEKGWRVKSLQAKASSTRHTYGMLKKKIKSSLRTLTAAVL